MKRLLKYFLICFGLVTQIYAQQPSKINLVHSDNLEYDEQKGGKVRKLNGHVEFAQDSAVMFCDSAHFPTEKNFIYAYSRVHIIKNDSIHIYGDQLNYDGDKKFAELFRHCKLLDNKMTLTTEYMTYDMNTNIANYNNNAKIVDKDNTLTSRIGCFYANENIFVFTKDVVLVNPKYVIHSDTLKYDMTTKIVYFFGPTTITSKENLIYCENGWYDTEKDVSSFKENAFIITKEQKMWGDSLYYDRKNGIGKAFRNVIIKDTVQKIIVSGNIGVYHEKEDESIVTDSAMMIQIFTNDSLFMHADTLKSTFDSINNIRRMFAYHHVRFFKEDLQGKCDSLTYSSEDSVTRMYRQPVIWSKESQMTGDTITITMKNKRIDKMDIYHNSFIISQTDTFRFDQIKGRNVTGYFDDSSHLYKIKVAGNGQTIYYGKDKEEKFVGVNRADCSDIWIYLTNDKVSSIKFLNRPDATFYPMNELSAQELKLKDFKWLIELKPKDRLDIFKE